jgi:GR25 family glycosyltransferase involved in LPS biosynthesis
MLSCDKPVSGIRRKIMEQQLSEYNYDIHLNISETGCSNADVAKGHINIWDSMKSDEWYIVIEDDIIVNDLNIPSSVGSKIDMISLYTQGIYHSERRCEHYSIIKTSRDTNIKNHGLCGYYIQSTYAKYLSDRYDYNQPIDHYVYDHARGNQLVTNKQQVQHKSGWSIKSKALV